MNREELQRLAEDRVLDAQALMVAERWSAAYYLLGYAIECGLKSCIMARVLRTGIIFIEKKFVDGCWTHDLTELLKSAGLDRELGLATKADQNLGENWLIAIRWSEIYRYRQIERVDAEELFEAVTNPTVGVLPWLKTHW